MATAIDQGKRMLATYPGDCAKCGRKIARGEWIYFSRERGSKHEACVEQGGDDAAPGPAAAPRDETARDARDAPARDGGGDGRAAGEGPPAYNVRRGERSLFSRPHDDAEHAPAGPAAVEPAAAPPIRPLAEAFLEHRLGERLDGLMAVGRELCDLLREMLARSG